MWLGASLAMAGPAAAAAPMAAPARQSAGSVHVASGVATSLGLHPTDFGVSPEFQKEQDRKADGIISQRNAQEARYGDSIRASKQMPPDPKPAPSTPAKPSSPPPKADKKAPPPAKPRDEDSAVWASKQMPADDPNAPRTPMEASK